MAISVTVNNSTNLKRMKNYYVTKGQGRQMIFRGTRQECEEYAAEQVKQWQYSGAPRWPVYEVFYDVGTEPVFSTATQPSSLKGVA